MKLKDISTLIPSADKDVGSLAVSGLASDSRKVLPGFLFAALKGSKADGGKNNRWFHHRRGKIHFRQGKNYLGEYGRSGN